MTVADLYVAPVLALAIQKHDINHLIVITNLIIMIIIIIMFLIIIIIVTMITWYGS